jgi:hypothetical protein
MMGFCAPSVMFGGRERRPRQRWYREKRQNKYH